MRAIKLLVVLVLATAAAKTKKPASLTTTVAPNGWYDLSKNENTWYSARYLFGWPMMDDYTLFKIPKYVNFFYILACVLSLVLTIIQVCWLHTKPWHPVFTILVWICYSDIVQSLGPLVIAVMDQYFLQFYDYCYGYPFYYIMTQKVVETLNIITAKWSPLLTLLLAGHVAFSLKKTPVFLMALMIMGSVIWGGVYFTRVQIGKYSECYGWYPFNGNRPSTSSYYEFITGEKWEREYRLIDGYMAFGICAGLLLIGFVACCKQPGGGSQWPYHLKSAKLIIFMSCFTFFFQTAYGLLAYIDNQVLPGYVEKSYLKLEKVMQICLLLNSILKSFFFFCVSTKDKTIPNTITVQPALARIPIAPTAPSAPNPQPTTVITTQPQPSVRALQPAVQPVMIPNVVPNTASNMMIPNVVPVGNGQGNMQVSVVVIPMPGCHGSN